MGVEYQATCAGSSFVMAEEIEEWERTRRNTRYGILENMGGRGPDTHYGMAFKTT